jgi:K+-transporting ATPase ATPase C chain
MSKHLCANLWLLLLTVLICSVAYPLVLLGIGQTVFRDRAQGSLVRDDEGKVRGSRLLAQPFTGDEYFWPRPSAVSYNAAASGASNWGASNPLLRHRVARQLGPIAKHKDGSPVGPDVERWFGEQGPDVAARWANDNPVLAEQWVKDNAAAAAGWLKKEEQEVKDAPGDAAREFFAGFAKAHPGAWPTVDEDKKVQPATDGADVQAFFFDPWVQAHPEAEMRPVPADLVMASGSGLDPHITLEGALYQLDRVAAAWAKKRPGLGEGAAKKAIEGLLRDKASAPLGGLVGVPLVNVLEVNRELTARWGMTNVE